MFHMVHSILLNHFIISWAGINANVNVQTQVCCAKGNQVSANADKDNRHNFSLRLPKMSIHIRGTSVQRPESDSHSISSNDDSDDDDENWDDWLSDSATNPCKSLFDEDVFPSAAAALQNDKLKHNFDLDDICRRLGCTCYFVVYLLF